MKYSNIITILLMVIFFACSKNDRQEVKEKMDTASHKLGRELDTLINTTIYSDSLYRKAPVEVIDTTSIPRKNFRDNLTDIFDEYMDIRDELVSDDSTDVVKQAEEFQQAMKKAQTESASEKLGSSWRLWVSSAEKISGDLKTAGSLESQRKAFSDLSASMETLIKNFGLSDITIYKVSCSTVKQKSNFWLTDAKDSDNPYYGKDKSNEKSIPCVEVQKAWKFN